MIARHTLSETMLDELADGRGGPAAVRALWRGQHSRRLLLLKLLIEQTARTPDRDDAVAAIVAAELQDPAARKILIEPMVGVWAAATIRSITGPGATAEQLGHLGAIAAATSLKAGTTSRLRGYSRGGWLYLPTLGRVRVPSGDGAVQLTTDNGQLRVDGTEVGPVDSRWQARRELSVDHEPRPAVCLEDVDPYRDAYHVAAADRLPQAEFDSWRRLLAETWRILTRHAPVRAAELAEGLQSLVPLQKPMANTAHSATAKEAVGVVGLDLPNSAADFAVALVHEFQHSKLTAVLDIVALYDGESDRTFFAPWRTDPRPIGGLLQGVYAFIAVADTWRALSTDPDAFPRAEHEFAEARAQVSDALDTLERSGLLTLDGMRFLAGMKRAVERLHAASVPAATDVAARQVLIRRRTEWDRTNSAR
jgi:uncharacterized protein